MTRATVLQEVKPRRFEALYERRQRRTLTMAEAAEMLGITERTFRRWSGRYHAEGAEGLQDRRIGRLSARAVPVDPVDRHAPRRDSVCARRAGRGQGQYGAVAGHEPTDPAGPPSVP